MTTEELQGLVRKRPFVPFRIYVSEGASFEIRHPELLMVGKDSAFIGLTTNPMQTTYDRWTMVDLLHIIRVEPIQAATTADGST
jgi:hypothetical protein